MMLFSLRKMRMKQQTMTNYLNKGHFPVQLDKILSDSHQSSAPKDVLQIPKHDVVDDGNCGDYLGK